MDRGFPGQELKKLLKKIGIVASPNCECNKRAKFMDTQGVQWCEDNIDTIVEWLKIEAEKRKLPFIELAAKILIKKAICNARKNIKKLNNKIFIQIASYRDPELVFTIKDCIEKAKHPENLIFGICWQHSTEDEWDKLDEFKNDPRFKIIDVSWEKSKGTCWARHKVQKLWSGEYYTLQLDSHHRFIENWDIEMINMWNDLHDDMAILTGYPPNYFPDKDFSNWTHVPHICNVYKIDHNGVTTRPIPIKDYQNKKNPVKGISISAGFIFARGQFNIDIPYDPDLYFSGEEISLAIRAFTKGYNIYHPHKVLLYHFYTRKDQHKHWSNHKDWGSLQKIAEQRVAQLLYGNNNIDLGIYGCGNVRTIQEYSTYSGIDFIKKLIHLDTINGVEPPCTNSINGWDTERIKFNKELCWDYNKIDICEDPRFWAFIILDQDNKEIYREDIIYKENQDIIMGKIFCKKFTFEHYKNRQIPKILLIWPYSESKHWLSSSRFEIS